jgi:DNA-directed RNA polymerase specialized sigma24 family protein
MAESKKGWVPTRDVFHQFLAWLDEGIDSGGETYLEMRRRLVVFFDRKRCLSPDDLADETLNRVARRLAEEGAITDAAPARYCYIVAKFVFLEYLRRVDRRQESFDGLHHSGPLPEADVAEPERRLECLERCLRQLTGPDRELILEYYRGEQRGLIERRRRLAAQLRVTANALSIRACRIRDKLEACVNACAAGQ